VRAASRGRLGAGDLKFAAGLGALTGALHPFYAIVLAFAVMVAGAARPTTPGLRPFGPSIAAAAAVALLAGPAVLLALHLPVRWR
jgi:prepilin signal peptidase PulO-like enzyme (type II secretory pathway)